MSHDDSTASRRSTAVLQPRLLSDRYEVIEVVGEGASAITWRGHDRRLDRRVAIKILRDTEEDGQDWIQRFEREARTSAAISHANVVHVYDVGQQDGWLYLVMQFVDGEDLKALIRRRGRLDIDEATGYARQVLAGLDAIHKAGILHRDIKPQNVLIDREGVARVTDFGIAQAALDPGLTTAGTTVGTAAYMAPEQAQAGTLSEATDIYATGIVLYEMLTGKLPYERATAVATMLAHIQERPEPPSRRAPDAGIPSHLDGIVLQAMARQPANRFRSARAMLRALDSTSLPDSVRGAATEPLPTQPVQDRTHVIPVAGRIRQDVASQRPPPTRRPPPPQRHPAASSGGRGLLNAVLVMLFLMMAVVAGYLVYELTRDDDRAGGSIPPVATETETEEPGRLAPYPTDPPPAAEATTGPVATTTPAPAPTQVPIEQATSTPVGEPDQIIEPDDPDD